MVSKVKRVQSLPSHLLKGKDGRDGLPGAMGPVGPAGDQGPIGPAPDHQSKEDMVRFKKPDGTWGPWIRAVTAPGGGGPDSFNQYVRVTTAEYTIAKGGLLFGNNVFGVDYPGDVTIFLPASVDSRAHITVKDESGSAGTNNITIKVIT